MRDIAVVDASVAVQWLLPELNTAEALQVLRTVPHLTAPELIYPEVANALWKRAQRGELTYQQGEQLIDVFLSIQLETYPIATLTPTAWHVAADFGVTVYDALYLTLAEMLHAPLITADHRLLAQISTASARVQMVWGADVPSWLIGSQ